MVPLSALGTLQYEVGPRQITRFNKMVAAEINAQSAPGVSSGDLYAAIEGIKLPAGYHIEWTGLSYQEKQNTGQIVFLMGLALLFAYLFLVAQYESWTIPVPVMLTVSFAVLGALLGLTVCGESMSIYAQLGLVMLIGLAAKNAILMVEFSKQEREGGKGIEEAALSGANLRFRAVMMTAWSFLFGVLPLVFADGAGAASRQAIGITTFAGMLAATYVGIVFTPALYAVFQRLREKASRKFRGGRAALCLLLAVGLSGLGGCTLGPDFKRADADVPENFLPGTLAGTGTPLRPSWWENFHDPLLTALVLEAQEGSLSVRQAVQRVAQSRAARMEARAEFLPDATGTGELARSRNYAPDGTATKLDASVQLALAVDVFGGLRRSLEAAGADLEAAGISLADARASLAVEVANGYVDLRLAQEKLRIALENVAVQRDTVRVIQARADARPACRPGPDGDHAGVRAVGGSGGRGGHPRSGGPCRPQSRHVRCPAVPRRAHTGIAQSAFGRAFRSAAPQAGRPQGRSRAPCGHGTHRGGPGRALSQLFPCGQRGRHFLGLRLLERRHEEPGRGAHGKLEHLFVRPEQGHGGPGPGSRGRGRSCVPGNGPGGPA